MKTLFDIPAHHKTDPPSSQLAEEKVTRLGRRARQCREVFDCLKRYDGSTSAELAYIMSNGNEREKRYMVARRLPDLEKLGMVRKGTMRQCARCKSMCVTWYVKSKYLEMIKEQEQGWADYS